jgi:hypothetical protein
MKQKDKQRKRAKTEMEQKITRTTSVLHFPAKISMGRILLK